MPTAVGTEFQRAIALPYRGAVAFFHSRLVVLKTRRCNFDAAPTMSRLLLRQEFRFGEASASGGRESEISRAVLAGKKSGRLSQNRPVYSVRDACHIRRICRIAPNIADTYRLADPEHPVLAVTSDPRHLSDLRRMGAVMREQLYPREQEERCLPLGRPGLRPKWFVGPNHSRPRAAQKRFLHWACAPAVRLLRAVFIRPILVVGPPFPFGTVFA